MFKPHKGICSCHQKERWLLNCKLECKIGIDERKRNDLRNSKKTPINKDDVRNQSSDTTRTSTGMDETKHYSREHGWSSRKVDSKTKSLVFKKRKPIQCRKKRTGEAKVFKEILEERGHTSQISGAWLGEGFNPWWFSHIVPKSIAPGLRLDPRNIILKTPEEHILWENHKHKIRDLPEWKWVFELEEQLKQEYYQKK